MYYMSWQENNVNVLNVLCTIPYDGSVKVQPVRLHRKIV